MRILQFLPYFPYPPSSGGRVRSLSLIERLSREHEVELACFVKPGEERLLSHLAPMCQRIHTIPRSGSPTSAQILALSLSADPILVRFYSSSYAQDLLKRLLLRSSFDVLHVETYYISQNLPQGLDVPTVLAESNIEYLLAKQMARRAKSLLWKLVLHMDALKQRVREVQAWCQADRCAAVTAEDASIISKFVEEPVCVVQNGVETAVEPVHYCETGHTHRILFVGSFLHRPNIDGVLFFMKEIFPLILERLPAAQLIVAGDSPTPEILAFQAPQRVEILGYVDDLRPVFEGTSVSICPIRVGGGSRVKILEALSRGHPVVTTTVGCSGLPVEHGKHLLVADRPGDFAAAVCSLLLSRDRRQSIGTQGRQLAISDYSWETSTSALIQCYESVSRG